MIVLSSTTVAQQTHSGIPLNAEWKQNGYDFISENLQYTAQGLAHSECDYLPALELAEREELELYLGAVHSSLFT